MKEESTMQPTLYELTIPQRSILDAELYYPQDNFQNLGGYIIFNCELSFTEIAEAFQVLLKENDAFRIKLKIQDGDYVQYIEPFEPIQIPFYDFTDKEKEFEEFLKEFPRKELFGCDTFLYRSAIFKEPAGKLGFTLVIHHMIVDGFTLVRHCLTRIVEACYLDKENEAKDAYSYVEFIKKEQAYKDSKAYTSDAAFWNKKVKNYSGEAAFSQVTDLSCQDLFFDLGLELSNKMRVFCDVNHISVYNLFMGAILYYKACITHNPSVVIGTPLLNRTTNYDKETMGMFVNTVPIFINLDSEWNILDFLKEIKKESFDLFRHRRYPYQDIRSYYNTLTGEMQNLLEIVFSYQNVVVGEEKVSQDKYNWNLYSHNTSMDVMNISVTDIGHTGVYTVEYKFQCEQFSEFEMYAIHRRLLQIISEFVENPDKKLNLVSILDKEEQRQIFEVFNDTTKSYLPMEEGKTVIDLFEEQVIKSPEHTALYFEQETMSYAEFNERVNCLAHQLRELGIGANDMIPVIANRSFEMMIGIYAVLKAGGAYVPVSPMYPEARVQYIVKDCKAKVVLTTCMLTYQLNTCVWDLNTLTIDPTKTQNPVCIHTAKDLAYVIYTSGTTGNPKGVMLEHGALMNRLLWMQDAYPIGAEDVILQKTTYTFDVSVWEIIWWSQVGAGVSLLGQGDEMVPEAIADCIQRTKVTTMHFVPSMLEAFLAAGTMKPELIEKCSTLRQVFASGEALKIEHVKLFYKLFTEEMKAKLVNLYGPTEAAIDVTYFNCERTTEYVPIGKPIHNIQIYILDEMKQIMPVGVSGELCITGVGLARGYLNNIELTEEKFIENPFGTGRLYCTGDVAKWMPDGNIAYLGRMDEQVKIRGFRIELNEIASVINSIPNVRTCAVVVKTMGASKQLGAYIVSENGVLDINEIREIIEEKLPDYMVPAGIMQIDEIPLTQNGKVNRKALPDIISERKQEYVAPTSKCEEELCAIFEEVLGVEPVGIKDNFFDLGGDSIKAIHIVSKCQGMGYSLNIRTILLNRTIEKIAQSCEKNKIELEYQDIGKDGWYKTSSSQRRMYLAQQKNKESIYYNVPDYVEVTQKFDYELLNSCMQQMIERHEILRTTFHIVDGEIMQQIHPYEEVDFAVQRICLEEGQDEEEVITSMNQPYDLEKLPLIRCAFIEKNDGKSIIVLNQHHIITDHISATVLEEELLLLYKGETLPPAEQYRDYVAWERSKEVQKHLKKEETFWLRKFSGKLPKAELPLDYKRSMEPDNEGATYSFEIEKGLLEKLQRFSKEQGVTVFITMFTAYHVLLTRLLNEQDVTIGVPVNNRNKEKFERMLGVFLNTLAIRNQMNPKDSFETFLHKVNDNMLESMEYQAYQFEDLINRLNIRVQPNRTPLFDTIVNYIHYEDKLELVKENGFQIMSSNLDIESAKFDITMYMFDSKESLKILCNYRKNLFKEETIQYFMTEYQRLLQDICMNATVPIETYTLFERKMPHTYRILSESHHDLVQTFEQIASTYADHLALKAYDEKMTYRELNERANALAAYIISKGIQKPKVALLFHHGVEMIVGILGALKAGAVFVPLDPTYPEERIHYMIDDAEVSILLTEQAYEPMVAELTGESVDAIEVYVIESERKEENPCISIPRDQIAYIMYTSGSTGKPKGVIQTNENILAFMSGYIEEYGITSEDRVSLIASYSHATGMIDIFAALLVGAVLCPYDIKNAGSMDMLLEWIESEKITIYHSVPSVYRYMLRTKNPNRKTNLRLIILGGESIYASDVKLYKEHFQSSCVFVNLFGSSEVLVATASKVTFDTELAGTTVPIGYLVKEVDCSIIDEQGKELGIYGVGEMVYTSPYLAKGYWKMPEKTNEVFTKKTMGTREQGRVYRSGDLGRLFPDGHFEYMGRRDFQVKIRGYRIELDEIEGAIDDINGIEKSVVTAKQNEQGEYYLVGFYTLESNGAEHDISEEIIKKELKKTVPSYMVPTVFMQLEEMPFTPNGKVDRQALQEVVVFKTQMEQIPARNDFDRKMMELWSEILDTSVTSIEDNFFELGGHSLNVTLLIGKIKKIWNVDISIKDVFAHEVLWSLSDYVADVFYMSEGKMQEEEIPRLEESIYYPASPVQMRMYLTQQMRTDSTAYNVPNILDVNGPLEVENLKESLYQLAERHEALRTGFEIVEGAIVQKVYPLSEIELEITEIQMEDSGEAVEEVLQQFVRPFQLDKAPLIRVCIGRINKEKYHLFFDLHHIICDGTSIQIMISDLSKIYNGQQLIPLELTYKDYAAWQVEKEKKQNYREHEAYWLEEFRTPPEILKFPADYIRPEIRSDEGAIYNFIIPKTVQELLHKAAKETGNTLFMLMLGALNITLSKYCHQEEITVGTAVAGRTNPSLESLVGAFINTLALKSKVDNRQYLDAYMAEVKETVLNAFEHQEYPFDELVEKVGVAQDASRAPFIEVLFLLQNMKNERLVLKDADIEVHSYKKITTKFDLSFEAVETEEGIRVKVEYSNVILKESTVRRFAEYWIHMMEQITQYPNKQIQEFYLYEEEMEDGFSERDLGIEFDF